MKKLTYGICAVLIFIAGSATSYRINLNMFKNSLMKYQSMGDLHLMISLRKAINLINEDNHNHEEALCAMARMGASAGYTVLRCINHEDCAEQLTKSAINKEYIQAINDITIFTEMRNSCNSRRVP